MFQRVLNLLNNSIASAAANPGRWDSFLNCIVAESRSQVAVLVYRRGRQMRMLHAGIASGRESETIDALALRSLRRADREGVSDLDVDALSSAVAAILNLQLLNVLAQRLGKDMDLVLLMLGQGGQKKVPHWFDALTHVKTLLAAAATSCVDAEDARIRAQLEVLNQLGHSAAMLDVHMDVVASNDLFESLLTRAKAGVISGGVKAPVYDFRIEAGLRKLARSTMSYAALPAQSGCGPILMQKIRVAIDPAVNLFAGAEMLAIVSEIQQSRIPSSGIIQDLFELTPAEARVAAEIASGTRVEQLASRFNVSSAAIRFHLKSVFLKTSTRRQAELAALLNGVQPIRVLGRGSSPVQDPDVGEGLAYQDRQVHVSRRSSSQGILVPRTADLSAASEADLLRAPQTRRG